MIKSHIKQDERREEINRRTTIGVGRFSTFLHLSLVFPFVPVFIIVLLKKLFTYNSHVIMSSVMSAATDDNVAIVRTIQNDETQLRTLVVILSMSGGLVIALTFGFGIYLYWHCRQQRKHSRMKADSRVSAIHCSHRNTSANAATLCSSSSLLSSSPLPSSSSGLNEQQQEEQRTLAMDEKSLPPQQAPCFEETVERPTPSAPTAKELAAVSATAATAPSCSPPSELDICDLPPPAYTPRSLDPCNI